LKKTRIGWGWRFRIIPSWRVNTKSERAIPPIVHPNDVADLPAHQGDRRLSTTSGEHSGFMGCCRHFRPNGPNIDFCRGVLLSTIFATTAIFLAE
jgi:hypothetical protein